MRWPSGLYHSFVARLQLQPPLLCAFTTSVGMEPAGDRLWKRTHAELVVGRDRAGSSGRHHLHRLDFP